MRKGSAVVAVAGNGDTSAGSEDGGIPWRTSRLRRGALCRMAAAVGMPSPHAGGSIRRVGPSPGFTREQPPRRSHLASCFPAVGCGGF